MVLILVPGLEPEAENGDDTLLSDDLFDGTPSAGNGVERDPEDDYANGGGVDLEVDTTAAATVEIPPSAIDLHHDDS